MSGINSATIPPAVSAATVADPTEVLITAAINHAINNGDISEPWIKLPIYVPNPLSIKICFKTPPPATTSKIIAIVFTASSTLVIISFMDFPRFKPKVKMAMITEIVSAISGFPKNTKIW